MALYQDKLESLRKAFPPPVSDPVHDGYVVFSLLRALDRVDALKTQSPLLGTPVEPDYEQASKGRIDEQGMSVEQVIPELVRSLEGMIIAGHPRSQVNVYAQPSIASIIGVMLPTVFSPNLCSDEAGGRINEAEVRVAAIVANLVGYDAARAGGLFTFGGTGALLYGLKIGLEKALPGSLMCGLREPAVVFASEQSHSSCLNVAGWLGIGQDQVIQVRSHLDNSIDLGALAAAMRAAAGSGRRVAGIVATMGTTDAFGIDDLAAVYKLRERIVDEFKLDYRPHIHADAVIGWAWSVFNDYDFQSNPLGFAGRTVRALAAATNRIRHLPLADSLGVDFHKTGFAPYISSLFLLRDRKEFQRISREPETMPYLFHTGCYHPGRYTLETSRGGSGPLSALASLMLLGKEGYRTLLGHAVEMEELLRDMIVARAELTVLNDENSGPVTLIRAYPTGVDTFTVKDRERDDPAFREHVQAYNRFNQRIYERVHHEALEGRGVAIGFTGCYRRTVDGEPINALKSYVLSPFADESRMHSIVEHLLEARKAVEGEMKDELPPAG